jgi:hypothetical protein
VCQVLVHAPWLALCAGDGDALLGGVVEEITSALEFVVEDRVAPWCDDGDGGLERVECKFESDLVVALASATMGNGEASLLLRNGNLGAGDDGAGERGAKKVDVLVNGIAGNGRVAELLDELSPVSMHCRSGSSATLCSFRSAYLAAQVLNVDSGGSDLQCLFLGSLEVLLLSDICHEGDNLIALLLRRCQCSSTL